MRLAFATVVLLACFVSASFAQPAPASGDASAKRPNILVILADDLGYSDLGCFGSEIPTPNVDRLAAGGVRLTQFYNNARCCPSRASLMTGRYPAQVGIAVMIDNYAKWQRDAAKSPHYSDHLDPKSPTAAELLGAAGYQTMMVGKWHLGNEKSQWPSARGFQRAFALIPGAMNYWGSATGEPPAKMELNGKRFAPPTDGSFFSTDAFTDRAVEFLSEAKSAAPDKPFFMYLAYNAPHWPLQARPGTIAKHKGQYAAGWQAIREKRFAKMRELGVIGPSAELPPMDRGKQKPWNELTDAERDEWDLRMAVYASMVEEMDRGVGKVLEALDRLGVADKTLVIFTSDNGGAAEDPNRGAGPTGTRDSFRGYARPWATVSNTPFFRHKVTAFEGGVSAPTVVRWPDGISKERSGTFVREPGHFVDLLPTLLHVAGATSPDSKFKPEGENLLPLLQGKGGNPNRTFAWEHEGHRGLRKGKWKIVRQPDAAQWDLFDIEADRAEQHNLAAGNPEVVKELVADYDAWAQRCGVQPWDQIAAKRPANPPGK